MKIKAATREYAKEISKLMLADLDGADPQFPEKMLPVFKKHATEESVLKEFDNPELIAYIAGECAGFIVGYVEHENTAMIHYISSGPYEMKHALLERFFTECKHRNISKVRTDTFEFMENSKFFKKEGFHLARKEKIGDIDVLWYEIMI